MTPPDPLRCTLFLIAAFCLAGVVQTAWLRSPWSRPLAIPLDAGRTWRGRRVFGENKTWKGFAVMVPAVGTAFVALAFGLGLGAADARGLWPLSLTGYFLLGCWSGLGYMLLELPNSFVKRQLDILPGSPPRQPLARAICFFVDQADSVVGALLALIVFVPVPLLTWVIILLAGPIVHWLFNVALALLGVKTRAA